MAEYLFLVRRTGMAIQPDFMDGYRVDFDLEPVVGQRVFLGASKTPGMVDDLTVEDQPMPAIVEGLNLHRPSEESTFRDYQGTIVNCRWELLQSLQ